MDPIQAAIEAIESRGPDEDFTYTEVAKRFGVVRSTLTRRHKAQMQPRDIAHRKIHLQQELELIQYIEDLTKRRMPPTRQIVQNFASSIAKGDVSESWVTRFINRNHIYLTSS